MKTTRFIALVLLCAISITALCGCFVNKYNAEIINADASDIIRDDFYQANYTIYAYYYIDGNAPVCIEDASYPETRTFLVKSPEEYDEIFSDSVAIGVDFSTEMIVVYTFTSNYRREIKITNAGLKNGNLEIGLKMIEPFTLFWAVGDMCMPYQRYVIIKTDKIDVSNVNVTLDI